MLSFTRLTTLFLLIALLAFGLLMPGQAVFAQDATPEPAATSVIDNDTGAPVDPSEGEIVTDADESTFDLNTIVLVVGSVVALFQTLIVSGSVGGLASAITNVLKAAGIVKDGQALNVMPALGVVLLGVVTAVVLLNPDMATQANLEGIITQASSLIGAGVTLVIAVGSLLGGGKLFHWIAKGFPVIGKSFENEAAKEEAAYVPTNTKNSKP